MLITSEEDIVNEICASVRQEANANVSAEALSSTCGGNEDDIIPVAHTLNNVALNGTGYELIRSLFLKFQDSLSGNDASII